MVLPSPRTRRLGKALLHIIMPGMCFPFWLVGRLGAVQKPYLLNRVSSKIKSGSLRLRASDLPRKLSLTEGPASSALSLLFAFSVRSSAGTTAGRFIS